MKRKMIIAFLCLLCVVSTVMIVLIQFIEPNDNNNKYFELKKTVVDQIDSEIQNKSDNNSPKTENKEERLNWDKIKSINPDIVGWITIPYTDYIDYPVLWNKTDNEDYQKYLYRDFDGTSTNYGSIFVDYRCVKGVDSENVILHGHSMNDGSMFRGLLNYGDADYYKWHSKILFETEKGKSEWIIFAVCKINVSDSKSLNYLIGSFQNESDKLDYVYRMRENSLFDTSITFNQDDNLLTLSTCSYETPNNRTVILARKLRKNEAINSNKIIIEANNDRQDHSTQHFNEVYEANGVLWYDGKINK